jgi:UDP-N-acetylglucosamine--N-acetylmuramyl-(pentapeptide) pyrophosphoryl-undecaprenol N-acetylglucosamine transferase
MEQDLVSREVVEFIGIQAGAMHGVGALRMVKGALKVLAGTWNALTLLRRWRPDVVLLTGGFVGVPVSVAAWFWRVPTVVYLPDIEPGVALKVMARLARKVATTTEASARFISRKKMVVTGYPVREAFARVTRQSARAHFGIAADEVVVLVYGGSKGARSINRAITANVERLLEIYGLRLIHVTGRADWDDVCMTRDALPPQTRERYLTYAYLHDEMADAMAAADLAVCRSGASTLGELPYLGLPAVLAPYPYAWRYQKVNAEYLVERGAAIMMEDAKLADQLVGVLVELTSDRQKLSAMRNAALMLAKRDGAEAIARLLVKEGARAKA